MKHSPLVILFVLLAFVPAIATPTHLGDLDEDGIFTANDLAKLVGHSAGTHPLSDTLKPFADLTQDGFVNDADQTALVNLILETSTPQTLPLANVREVSPASGEGNVAVTRETVLHFSMPLALNATIDTNKFKAEFGGRKILSRVEVSSDRKKATLFYLEPLPSNARVRVTFDSSGVYDLLGRPLDGDGNGQLGGVYATTFDTVTITPVAGTAVSGRIFASERATGGVDTPLAGVTISVDGAEESLRAVTDAQGNFTLSPCPAGEFFVHIDGRTSPMSSYPSGAYYPVVGKKWQTIAGRTDNLAVEGGTIYLPCICAGTLQATSATQNSVITFPPAVIDANPALAGVQIDVPANALFADDGTRGGRIGIAPVASDRLPEPLPPGLQHTLDISIQSDGAMNFDRPVPVCFPNLPDPVTGVKLEPGAKSALWSFNHDTGQWEVVGPMTVTEDGNFVKTDAGVGVKQPGWHGTQPGTQEKGGRPRKPKCPDHSLGEWLELAYEVGKEAASCASEFVKVAEGLKCALELASLLADVSLECRNLGKELATGKMTLEAAKSSIEILDNLKQQVEVATDCLIEKAGVPEPTGLAALAIKIFNCIGNVLAIGNSICDFVADQPPNTPESCKPGRGVRIVCKGIEIAKALHSEADNYVKLAQNAAGNATSAATDYAIADIKNKLNEIIIAHSSRSRHSTKMNAASANAAATEELLTPTEIQGLLEKVNAINTAAVPARDAFAKMGSSAAPMASLIRGTTNWVQSVSTEIDNYGTPVAGECYYAIETVTTIIRGKLGNGNQDLRVALPATTQYVMSVYMPIEDMFIQCSGLTGDNGSSGPLVIPLARHDNPGLDPDGDGLGANVEFVLGTDPNFNDSDADGIPDGTEVKQGTNPLDGLAVQTGTIASAPTSAAANDICALNNIAVVAQGDRGVCVFNVFSGLNPTRILEVDTPGLAQAVACGGRYVAVADGGAGLAILDVGDPGNIRLTMQVPVGGTATSVATDGITVYVGTAQGQVVEVDLETGRELRRLVLASTSTVEDLQLVGDALYVLQSATLRVVTLTSPNLVVAGSLDVSLSRNGLGSRFRLFVAAGKAYCVYAQGYRVVDVSNAASPTLLQSVADGQQGWKQLVLNGSGLGLACAGPNPNSSGVHDLNLHNVGADGLGSAFITTMETPGIATAVSVYNGFAYVADGASGLQVINYLAFDNQKQVPTIALSANVNLASGTAEEGKRLRLTAAVTDDVQVRNVEFYVDGQLAVTDGSYPFEHAFITPSMSATKTTVLVKAKATDTGGNTAWSTEYTLNLIPDATPPSVASISPPNNTLVGAITDAFVVFSEPMDVASLASGIQVTSAGPDGTLGNGDDVVIVPTLSWRSTTNTAFITFTNALTPGRYQIRVAAPAADSAGNALASATTSAIRVFSFTDTDNDGMADDWEPLLGLTVGDDDSDNDGILDGAEDFDNDGLSNAGELILSFDPRTRDSNGNGIDDGLEDIDQDGLTNQQEFLAGTNPNLPDTDSDGWKDGDELLVGSDPTNPNSRPSLFIASAPPVTAMRFGSAGDLTSAGSVIRAQPAVTVLRISTEAGGGLGNGAVQAAPPVFAVRFGTGADLTSAGSIIKASPDVTVMRFGAGDDLTSAGSLIKASPHVTVMRFGNGDDITSNGSVIQAVPAVNVLRIDASLGAASAGTILASPGVQVLNGADSLIAKPPVSVQIQP